jgi:acetoin utilization protein AcuB
MRVRDLMTPYPITVPPSTSVVDARHMMEERRIRHLLVTEEHRLLGIVTDRDIRLNMPSPATALSIWELNYLLNKLTVGQVMKRSVIVVDPDREAADAAILMVAEKIGALPVIYGGELVGIVTETDFLGAFVAAAMAGRAV